MYTSVFSFPTIHILFRLERKVKISQLDSSSHLPTQLIFYICNTLSTCFTCGPSSCPRPCVTFKQRILYTEKHPFIFFFERKIWSTHKNSIPGSSLFHLYQERANNIHFAFILQKIFLPFDSSSTSSSFDKFFYSCQ